MTVLAVAVLMAGVIQPQYAIVYPTAEHCNRAAKEVRTRSVQAVCFRANAFSEVRIEKGIHRGSK